MKGTSRAAYAGTAAAVGAAGAGGAQLLGWGTAGAVWAGVALAWTLQVPSFWRLAGALARGEPVLRDWIGGMALRLGGLGLVAVAGGVSRLPGAETAVAYVAALMAFLGLEAVWLLRRQRRTSGEGRRRRARKGASGPPTSDR